MGNSDKGELEYFSVADLQRHYGFGNATIWRWVKEGRFPQPVRIGKRWTRWRKADVEAFINRNQTPGE